MALAGGYLEPGTRLNNTYEVDSVVGEGGMGVVYRGHLIETGDPVAIKVIRAEMAHNESALALFRKEAAVLNNLLHEAIVRYYVFSRDQTTDRPFLATEFVDGRSLADVIEDRALSHQELIDLTVRLADGLQAAHRLGVTHRDISPDNVILPGGDVNRAKIIDFGIARATEFGGKTVIGDSIAGKFDYMSPEQLGLFGGNVGPRSDMYSLGIVLAEAARGRSMAMGGTQVEVVEKRRTVPPLDGIEPRFKALLSDMLQPKPQDRPETMTEIAARARQIGSAPQKRSKAPALIAAAVAIPVMVGAVLYGADMLGSGATDEGDAGAQEVAVMTGPAPLTPAAALNGGEDSGSEANDAGTDATDDSSVLPSPALPAEAVSETEAASTAPSLADPEAAPSPSEGEAELSADEIVIRLGGDSIDATEAPDGPRTDLALAPADVASDAAGEASSDGQERLTPADVLGVEPDETALVPGPVLVTPEEDGPGVAIPEEALPANGLEPDPQPRDRAPSEPTTIGATEPADNNPATVSVQERDAVDGRQERADDGEFEIAMPDPRETVPRPQDGIARYVSNYDAGDCTWIRPMQLGPRSAKLEAFGAEVPPFVEFDEAFARSLGFEADIGLRLVKDAQCPAIEFVRQLKAAGAKPLQLTIDSDTIRSGYALTGTVNGLHGRELAVLVINENGRVYPIDAVAKLEEDEAALHTRISGGPPALQPHLLMVIASDELPEALTMQNRGADEFFAAVDNQLLGRESEVKAQVTYFKFGG